MRKKNLWILMGLATVVCLSQGPVDHAAAAVSFIEQVQGQQTAVVVYPLNPAAERFTRNALSRVEGILLDNGVDVLDREKAEALKDVFQTLDDPGAFVTAETFVENSEKFAIKGLVALYLSVDTRKGLAEYYTATAHVDVRYIGEEDAQVHALATLPMGTPGQPPSDGLTRNSAVINAVQRAVDSACQKLGFELIDPASPRSVSLTLEGPLPVPVGVEMSRTSSRDTSIKKYALLEKQPWRGEDVTCSVTAPGGSMGAVGGYIVDTDFRRKPQRLYGSRVHVIDVKAGQEILVLDCHTVEKKAGHEKGTRKVLDCMFVLNWRYLTAVTGNALFLWDTERGRMMASTRLEKPLKKAELGLGRSPEGSYLVIRSGKKQVAYAITRKK
ncbi:MAG: hypothetical protein JRF32_09430 [Deltaproteobacteria bacterium]|nr:hypothetical protein [Deltaproteobacteria bacterium]